MSPFFKKCIAASLLIGCSVFVFAQSTPRDSLLQRLAKNIHDTDRVMTMLRVSKQYFFTSFDTSRTFAEKALTLSRKLQFKPGELKSLTYIGSLYQTEGKLAKALQVQLQVLRLSEDMNDRPMIAASYNNIALVYEQQHDRKNALVHYLLAKTIYEQIKESNELPATEMKKISGYHLTLIMNIGNIYEQMNRLDSALHYQHRAYDLALKEENKSRGTILVNLGKIYYKLKEQQLAESHYRSAIPHLVTIEENHSLADAYLGIAQILQERNQHDSALKYAYSSLGYAQAGTYEKGYVDATLLLAHAYEKKQMVDSAYFFFKASIARRDSILNDEVIREIQTMNFAEQIRQQERTEARLREAKERTKLMQMLGIAIFIIVFFGFIVLMSKSKRKPRWLHYLGLVGLLLMFEFVSYLKDPIIAKISDDTPVFMVLGAVVIAIALIPLHNRLEQWMIRLTATTPLQKIIRTKTPKAAKTVKKL